LHDRGALRRVAPLENVALRELRTAPEMAHTQNRRLHGSPLDLVARTPWWVCVGLAVLFWALIPVAARGAAPGADAPTWAGVCQVVVPLLFLGAAALSALRRRKRRVRRSVAAESPGATGWAPMAPGAFEARVAEAFRQQGYQVTPTSSDGRPDRDGVSLVLRMNRETHLLRCLEWQQPRVPASAVQALQRAMTSRGAAGGFALTSGRFTREAHAFASACNVRLVEGRALALLVQKGRPPF
jgi:restriction system protein